ncbi:MAG: hypothetical protein C0401_03770 [Anaerolinea sp.]|nr:hypothetical protein [Anaerolinea sp.]
MLYGIDVSRYQELIDWQKVKKSGVRFAIIKASEGEGYIDPMFEENLRGAVEAGILPGSYHFFLPRYDPLAQARHYVRVLQEYAVDAPTLPPCIDLETPGLGKSSLHHLHPCRQYICRRSNRSTSDWSGLLGRFQPRKRDLLFSRYCPANRRL